MKNLAKVLALVLVVAMVAVVLTACAPKDVEAAIAKMEEAGYEATGYQGDNLDEEYKESGAIGMVTASKGEGFLGAIGGALQGDMLMALLYDSTAAAKDALAEAQAYDEDTDVQRIGKWLVMGSEDAIAAFKK